MTRNEAKTAIDKVWYALENASHKNIKLEELWRSLNEATQKNERDHRKWGPRWKQHHPKSCSVETAARYFAAIAPFREFEPPKSWLEVAGLRDDWAYGHAFAEKLRDVPEAQERVFTAEILPFIEVLKSIDYGEHLVR